MDLGIRNVERHTRHFFIPFDWLSAGADLMIDVTCNGDIIFVKQHEIAIIKRGLEASEQGPNAAGARSPIRVASRPSLASSRSLGSDDMFLEALYRGKAALATSRTDKMVGGHVPMNTFSGVTVVIAHG